MINRRMMAISLGIVILLVGGGLVVNQLLKNNRTVGAKSWPAFTMIYTTEGFGMAPAGAIGSQTTELIYDSVNNWKVTITQNSAFPALQGTWSVYDGQLITHYNAESGETTVNDVSNEEGFRVPDQWLAPLYVPALLKTPGVIPEPGEEPNLQKIVVTDESPCDPFTAVQQQAGLAECKADQTARIATREVTYDTAHLIPLKIIDKLDGTAMYTVTVDELTFQ